METDTKNLGGKHPGGMKKQFALSSGRQGIGGRGNKDPHFLWRKRGEREPDQGGVQKPGTFRGLGHQPPKGQRDGAASALSWRFLNLSSHFRGSPGQPHTPHSKPSIIHASSLERGKGGTSIQISFFFNLQFRLGTGY